VGFFLGGEKMVQTVTWVSGLPKELDFGLDFGLSPAQKNLVLDLVRLNFGLTPKS